MKINNMPDYAWGYQFIVYSINEKDNTYWFYGAYNEIGKALSAMLFVNGNIVDVKEVERDA